MSKSMWANPCRWVITNDFYAKFGGQISKRKPWLVVPPDGHKKPGKRFRTQPQAFLWAVKQATKCKCDICAKGMRSMWSDRGYKRAFKEAS